MRSQLRTVLRKVPGRTHHAMEGGVQYCGISGIALLENRAQSLRRPGVAYIASVVVESCAMPPDAPALNSFPRVGLSMRSASACKASLVASLIAFWHQGDQFLVAPPFPRTRGRKLQL